MAEIKRVGVCGCGLMGSGIAQVAATAGYDVVIFETVEAALKKGMAGITLWSPTAGRSIMQPSP